MDTYQTPGDKKAVKNRAPRCFPDKRTSEEIKQANIRGEHSICIRRRFSSTPEDCFDIHVDLATQIVSICVADNKLDGVFDTLKPEEGRILNYLLNRAKVKYPTGAACRICKKQMKLENFHTEHGTSEAHSAQLGHIHPYIGGYDETAHVKGNVQWIHRDCNIIQGEKTEDETFNVLAETLRANGYEVNKND